MNHSLKTERRRKMLKKLGLVLLALALLVPPAAFAHGGGGMMGSGGGMQGGGGILVVADDGSLLVTEMAMGGMMGGGTPSYQRALYNLSADGSERWRASFTEGWPMMPATQGDLVVFALVDDWWMGGGSGDMGWTGGGEATHDDQVTLVGLDLATGAERWRTTLAGDMASMTQLSPDGSRIYVTLRSVGEGGHMGSGPLRQGDVAGAGSTMTTTVVALDRSGAVLWSKDLGTTGGMQGGR